MKKKTIAIICAALLIFGLLPAAYAVSFWLPGDFDGNGTLENTDLVSTARVIVGLDPSPAPVEPDRDEEAYRLISELEAKLDELQSRLDELENEPALKPEDFASISMFQHIGVIGDSFASGQLWESAEKERGTFYELSWGQELARMNGVECLNLSSGGLTTRTWLERPRGLELLNSSDPQQLYICALGINDSRLLPGYLGSIEDIHIDDPDQNADTFYGNYGRIICAIKAKAPNAKIILSTLAKKSSLNKSIMEIADLFEIPYIVQLDDPFFTDDFYTRNMSGGHPTAPVYSGMAKAIQRLVEGCMAENPDYFADYTGK